MTAMKFTIDVKGIITPLGAVEFFAAVPTSKPETLREGVDMADATIEIIIYKCAECEKVFEHPVGHTKTYDCEC